MSESIMKYDFKNLKFNLYEIMKLDNDCTPQQVKKTYRKLVSKFHPDKNTNNSELEEDIFNHIIIAYQVLSNPVEKDSYDRFLNKNSNNSTFEEMKGNYDSSKYHSKDSYDESKKKYEMKVKQLEEKHKLHMVDNSDPLTRIKSLKKVREQVKISREHIINNDDFNDKFTNRKSQKPLMKGDGSLIPINQNKYAIMNSYDDLYVNDSIVDEKFSSLDNAFKLNPEIKYKEEDISKKMNRYENDSELLKNNTSFLDIKFENWKN